MFRRIVVLLVLVLPCGCGDDKASTKDSPSTPGPGGPINNPLAGFNLHEELKKLQFGSPRATMESFIRSAEKKVPELMAACIAESASAEFSRLRKGELSDSEFADMCDFFTGAEVVSVEEEGDEAVVSVKTKRRDEEISLVKEADGWKIADF